jgi:hypothetical protein
MKHSIPSSVILTVFLVVSIILVSGCEPTTNLESNTFTTKMADNLTSQTQSSPFISTTSPFCSFILPTIVSTLIPITKPNPTAGAFCELGVLYISKSGLTVTLDAIYSITHAEYYDLAIEYQLGNNTTDKIIDEDRFKAFYKDGSGETQAALFGRLAPGQTITKSYVWRAYWNNVITHIEYEPDSSGSSPSLDALKWKPPTS